MVRLFKHSTLLFIFAVPINGFSNYGAGIFHQTLIDYQIKLQNKTFIWNETSSVAKCYPAIDGAFSDVTGYTDTGSFITKSECVLRLHRVESTGKNISISAFFPTCD